MKIIMNLEVSKGYSIWKEVFLNNEDNRQRHNVKVLLMVMKKVMKIKYCSFINSFNGNYARNAERHRHY